MSDFGNFRNFYFLKFSQLFGLQINLNFNVVTDVSDTSSFESIKEQVKEIVQEDGLHILLNNAGTLKRQRY